MLLVDYVIEVVGNSIWFDPELSASLLHVRDGDKFVVHCQDGRVKLVRLPDGQ